MPLAENSKQLIKQLLLKFEHDRGLILDCYLIKFIFNFFIRLFGA